MAKNKYSRELKSFVCSQEKNQKILEIIYTIGHEKILQSQLIELLLFFEIYGTERSCQRAISNLEDYQIIKKIKTANNNKFVILTKAGRAFVKDLPHDSVSAHTSNMSISNQNERILRTRIFLDLSFWKFERESQKYKTKEDFMKELFNSNFNTLIFKENETQKFYDSLLETKLEKKFDMNNLEKLKVAKHDEMATLRQLIKRNLFLISAKNIEAESTVIFNFYMLDANNRYTPRKFSENVKLIHQFVKSIIRPSSLAFVSIKYFCTDKDHSANLQKVLKSREWDGEINQYIGLSKLESLDPVYTVSSGHLTHEIKFFRKELK